MKARWEYADSPPRSLSGVRLQGTKLSRHIYIDESGVSKEKLLVVAGVIIDPDREFTVLEQYLDALAKFYVPPEHYFPGFPLHFKDLFHGTDVWDKRTYPRERSLELLNKLVGIPATTGLPMVWGYIKTSEFNAASPDRKQHLQTALNQNLAFSLCLVAAEKVMREYVVPNEYAWTFAETNYAADVLKMGLRMLRGQYGSEGLLTVPGAEEYLPLRRIKEAVNLVSKNDSIVMQLADMCAGMFRYSLEGRQGCDDLFQILTKNNAAKLPTVGPDDVAGYHSICFGDALPKEVAQTDQ